MTIPTAPLLISYKVTGCAAHSRMIPLLPQEWLDRSSKEEEEESSTPNFLWENAPRHETKEYRDNVQCYSHLPNGLTVLDSKWALARLFALKNDKEEESSIRAATLASHCFRGATGFQRVCNKVGMFSESKSKSEDEISNISLEGRFPDLLSKHGDQAVNSNNAPPAPRNMWVIKDDMSNGAGGIWMVNPGNAASFADEKMSPLSPDHRYVAQQYTWPPVLFDGKKCHVRVYGLFTADSRAYVHRQCFLHVANEVFATNAGMDEDSVHITNCCANSHDESKFAGEICSDLLLHDDESNTNRMTACGQPIVPLGPFFDSIAASVALLAKRAFPFLKGGDANHGFEYLGMDFILSYDEDAKPVAYMLEVNAPPSQDTATGLPHAENLHDAVLSDLIHLWVLPSVTGVSAKPGGWQCVHEDRDAVKATAKASNVLLPSKAVILNKIRWAISERKAAKRDEEEAALTAEGVDASGATTANKEASTIPTTITGEMVAKFARSQFPYFSTTSKGLAPIFMESAGGAQVPHAVVDAMTKSLSSRHRSVNGSLQKEKARRVAKTLLGCNNSRRFIYFGTNATTLLQLLAHRFSRNWSNGDEIVLCNENHEANTSPWIETAARLNVTVKWWSVKDFINDLKRVLSPQTKLVAFTHASNLFGHTRNLVEIGQLIRERCGDEAQIVIDGVAAVPHVNVALDNLPFDCWYSVSCHKLFGPHLGILCGPDSDATAATELELGTVNYEACAGLIGLGEYFRRLATFSSEQAASQSTHSQKDRRESTSASEDIELTQDHVLEAYRRIEMLEDALVKRLVDRFQQSSPKVHLLDTKDASSSVRRLPIIGFCHDTISCATIVEELAKHRVSCREGNFKCSDKLQEEFGFATITRLSFAHYNTAEEIDFVMDRLEAIPGWH